MTVIALLITLVTPAKWYRWQLPVNTGNTCWSAHLVRLHECAVQHPDATSIQRAVCEAASRGQYTACIEGIP